MHLLSANNSRICCCEHASNQLWMSSGDGHFYCGMIAVADRTLQYLQAGGLCLYMPLNMTKAIVYGLALYWSMTTSNCQSLHLFTY
jgi:hypothetical protein